MWLLRSSNKLKPKSVNGYMTVEATMVFPLVLSVCVISVFLGIYVYNRCVMQQDAYRVAREAVQLPFADYEEKYNAAWDRMEYLLEDKYILLNFDYSITVGRDVTVEVSGMMKGPKTVGELTGRRWYCVEEQVQMKQSTPALFIRTCRALGIERDK